MTTWNYRMFRRSLADGLGGFEDEFFIGEAYYDEAGTLTLWSAEPVAARGSTKIELMDDLALMAAAMSQPYIDLEATH